MKKLLLIAMFLTASVAMQIKSVEFKGLIHLSPEIAKEVSGLSEGKEFNYELGDRAVKKLYKQGYFDDVWIEEDNGNVIVNVTEKPTIALIDIDGVSDDDKKNIKSMLGLNKGMVYDKSAIKSAKNRIIKYFEAKGYFDTVVEEDTAPLEEVSSLKVVFRVNRGENIIIRDIKLSGAKALDYDDIEPGIINKQREVFGWMWGRNDGKLRLEALPTDPDRIRDEYYARGFLDAKISNPYLRLYYDTYDANIVYKVNEGGKYKVGSIDITLAENIIDIKALKDDLRLQKGDTFDVKKLRKDMKFMETEIANKGYAFARIYPETVQDKENHIVKITYTILPGSKVTIGKVVIGGNARTADNVIRRDVYLSAGDLYNRTSLKESKNSLKRTGYFSDISISEKRISKDIVDLYVNVKEASTGSIRGGIGYGTSQGFLLDIGLTDRNIFGTGLRGSVNVNRSKDELSGTISLTNPRVFDSEYSLGGSLYAKKNSWNSYDERIYGGSVTAGRRLGKHTHASLRYVLEETEITKLAESLKEAGYRDGKNLKSAITPTLSFDNTDDYYLPRRGLIASTSLEYAGLGGDEEFLKSISKFKIFYGLEDLIGYDLILRYKARVRMAKDNGYLPLNERLYLGGISSVRGFDSRSIGPRNDKGYVYGGKRSFNNSVEASFPLIKRIKMRGAVFYDYGMIGIDSFDEYTRSSAGLAIEWLSPLGAINLIYAKPINPLKGDETSSFEFSIGRQF